MNGTQVIEEIIRYLDDENYRYAVLIDGVWGCGKTFFALHDMKDAIETHENMNRKRKLKYLSLYGCKSTDEIAQRLYWSIIDKNFFEMKDSFLDKIGTKAAKNLMQSTKVERKISSISQTLVGVLMQRFNLPSQMFDTITEFISLNKYVFVFDDLERCRCPINDVLGYINSLVEHDEAKVIIVANENEIGKLQKIDSKEMQNLVAAQSQIIIPEERLFGKTDTTKGKRLQEFTLEELERRRKLLFSESKVWDNEYRRIREKLIGITISFEPDVNRIIGNLIEKISSDDVLKNTLKYKLEFFLEKMTETGHVNLRTFQFYLSKIEYLYHQFKKLHIDNLYEDQTLNFIIESSFELCIQFKANLPESVNRILRVMLQNRVVLPSIKKYIEFSLFEYDSFKQEIDQYIESNVKHVLPKDDPYHLLTTKWYVQSQVWVQRKIDEMSSKLAKSEYPYTFYPSILYLLIELKNVGFGEAAVNSAVNCMINNLKSNCQMLSAETIELNNDERIIEKCKELIEQINSKVVPSVEKRQEDIFNDILSHKSDWGKLLKDYITSNRRHLNHQKGILNKIESKVWIKILKESDSPNIFFFRQFIEIALPSNVFIEGSQSDMPIVKDIMEDLMNYKDPDLIKNMQLKKLCSELEDIYKDYTTQLAAYNSK